MTMMPISRMAGWFALAWALIAYVVLLYVPMYSTMSVGIGGGGVTTGRASLATANGPGIYAILAIPVFAALLAVLPWPHALRRPATGVGALIATVFAFLGVMTVGLFFLPTAAALILAAASGTRHEPASAHTPSPGAS